MSDLAQYKCPCCQSFTLTTRQGYEICDVCDWEDDGQDDQDADIVKGGPNADYSLTEARENYKNYGAMYRAGPDLERWKKTK